MDLGNRDKKLLDHEARLVGRRGAVWPWLLGLLVLVLIGGYIWAKTNHKLYWSDKAPNTTIDDHGVNSPKSIVTDFNSIYQTEDIADLDNRPFEINNLIVRKVVTDKVFLVSNDTKNPSQLYLVFREENGATKPSLKVGQKVNVVGTTHVVPTDMGALNEAFKLNATQQVDFKAHLIYGETSSVIVVK